MRADDIRGLSDDDVVARIAELERERFNLRFKSGTQSLEDPLRLRVVRKDLARLKTVQRERALGVTRAAATPAAPATGARKGAAKKGTSTRATKRTTKSTTKAPARSGRRSGR
jgi:large subunit ribosomal protein L29